MIKRICFLFFMMVSISLFSKENEEMRYNLKLGFLKAGEAKILIADTIFENKQAVHYLMELKTTGLSNSLIKIHDIYESIVNPENMLPYKSVRNINEGSYKYYNEVIYYHDVDSIQSLLSGKRKVPENLIDFLTIFFYYRVDDFFEKVPKGEFVTLPTLDSDEISDVSIYNHGLEETRTKAGKMDCYVLSPNMKKGKVLNSRDGLKLIISQEDMIPVVLEFDVTIGKLKGVLKSYTVNGEEKWD